MQITLHQVKNTSYIVVDDLYTPEEVRQIKDEVKELLPLLERPTPVTTAVDEAGNVKNNGKKLYIDSYYPDRDKSNILRINRKLFCKELLNKATELNKFFAALYYCNSDYTLINQYGSGENYKPHEDNSVLSAITFFAFGEFSGGGLEFPEINTVIPFKENRTVIFAGCTTHATEKIIAEPDVSRISMVQFLNYVPRVQ
jgi:hypothetical protein